MPASSVGNPSCLDFLLDHMSVFPISRIAGYPSFLNHFLAGARAHGSPSTEPKALTNSLHSTDTAKTVLQYTFVLVISV